MRGDRSASRRGPPRPTRSHATNSRAPRATVDGSARPLKWPPDGSAGLPFPLVLVGCATAAALSKRWNGPALGNETKTRVALHCEASELATREPHEL